MLDVGGGRGDLGLSIAAAFRDRVHLIVAFERCYCGSALVVIVLMLLVFWNLGISRPQQAVTVVGKYAPEPLIADFKKSGCACQILVPCLQSVSGIGQVVVTVVDKNNTSLEAGRLAARSLGIDNAVFVCADAQQVRMCSRTHARSLDRSLDRTLARSHISQHARAHARTHACTAARDWHGQ